MSFRLHRAAAAELQRRSQTQVLMAPASADVRVARFLLTFGQRQQAVGCSAQRFRLRMSRRDIASYLSVAHETVSRAFTLLGQAGLISVDHREVGVSAEQISRDSGWWLCQGAAQLRPWRAQAPRR